MVKRINFSRTFIFIFAVYIVFLLLIKYWPIGPDYYYVFRPVTEAFFDGETRLYDSNSNGFYISPWSLLVFFPTTLFPVRQGQAILSIFSILGLMFSGFVLIENTKNKFNLAIIVLALVNLHTFDLLLRGNLDGILVFGIGLSWLAIRRKNAVLLGVGLWLLSIKPVNIILAVIVFLKITWNWSWRDKFVVSIPLVVSLLLSFPIFGFSWPIRYIKAIVEHPPMILFQTSIWRVFELLGFQKSLALWLFIVVVTIFVVVIIKIESANEMILALALSLNLVFSPYTLGSHYVLLIPTFIILSQKSKLLTITWLFTLTPLARISLGVDIVWIDIFYPIALLIGALYFTLQMRFRPNPALT